MVRKKGNLPTDIMKELMKGEGEVHRIHILHGEEEFKGMGRLFAKHKLAPGASIGFHAHTGEQEAYYILAGKALYDSNGEEVEVEAGDMTLCPSGEGHAIKNIGDIDLEFIGLIYTVTP